MPTKIITSFAFQPIAAQHFAWLAFLSNRSPGGPLGHGSSKQAAITDLLEQLELSTYFAVSD
jgi:hypothetical protein